MPVDLSLQSTRLPIRPLYFNMINTETSLSCSSSFRAWTYVVHHFSTIGFPYVPECDINRKGTIPSEAASTLKPAAWERESARHDVCSEQTPIWSTDFKVLGRLCLRGLQIIVTVWSCWFLAHTRLYVPAWEYKVGVACLHAQAHTLLTGYIIFTVSSKIFF